MTKPRGATASKGHRTARTAGTQPQPIQPATVPRRDVINVQPRSFAVAWLSVPGFASYSATKSAAWSLADGLRFELKGQGTHVVGLLMGPVDTDMGAQFPFPDKVGPAQVVTAALDGIESGADEVPDALAGQLPSVLAVDRSQPAAYAGPHPQPQVHPPEPDRYAPAILPASPTTRRAAHHLARNQL
ncbi:SDR family NAD(P)-dependent oxidoreductase [Streptomyces sp. KK5PA1]|uniref:SDR family NAD(P)-dependent oxidoreductase n=1 Tax=Actinacidiphila acididurans TaxID=2784346 RepID=A0ABS2TWN3_9ACTN|nr:SDR family NAD(P)-dependent oxidoreductase [Actinacidiphila acididurans]MBM9506891.1 SDR family NAD(P)-dependent oxidoreductase [Actinacidiphila acididurans]